MLYIWIDGSIPGYQRGLVVQNDYPWFNRIPDSSVTKANREGTKTYGNKSRGWQGLQQHTYTMKIYQWISYRFRIHSKAPEQHSLRICWQTYNTWKASRHHKPATPRTSGIKEHVSDLQALTVNPTNATKLWVSRRRRFNGFLWSIIQPLLPVSRWAWFPNHIWFQPPTSLSGLFPRWKMHNLQSIKWAGAGKHKAAHHEYFCIIHVIGK